MGATYDMTTSMWPTSGCRHLAILGADIWLPMYGVPRSGHWRLGSQRLRGQILVAGIWLPAAWTPVPGAWIWALGSGCRSGCRGLGSRHPGGSPLDGEPCNTTQYVGSAKRGRREVCGRGRRDVSGRPGACLKRRGRGGLYLPPCF